MLESNPEGRADLRLGFKEPRRRTEERFVFDVVVCEEERDPRPPLPSDAIQSLQVLQQVAAAVRPAGQKKKDERPGPPEVRGAAVVLTWSV